MLAACGGASTSSTTAHTTVAGSEALTVKPLQYRDDIVANRVQLQVTNGLSRQLPLASVQLLWSGMNSELAESDAVIGPGQRVDLPVGLGPPSCRIDGTAVGASPDTDAATVVFTLTDGSTEVAAVLDPDGTLGGLHADACEREMIGQQVSLEFADFSLRSIDGRDVTVAVLRMRRLAAPGDVEVQSSGNTIPFNLLIGEGNATPLLALPAAAAEVEVPVQFLEARCDAHAVAEAKQPFRFVMQVSLGGEPPRPYVVEPPPAMHSQMLATAAAGCAVLGEDGSLSSEG